MGEISNLRSYHGLIREVRIAMGFLTGHIALNRHLAIIGIRTDQLCPACDGEEEETAFYTSWVVPMVRNYISILYGTWQLCEVKGRLHPPHLTLSSD